MIADPAVTSERSLDRPLDRPLDQSGRELGPRALQTRQRLLEATAQLLVERSVRDVSVVEIARAAGTSPATFYQYFKDVSEATLRLAEQAAEEMPEMIELISGSWDGDAGLERARRLVDAFVRHWDAHRAVLLVRNLAADQGDRRFLRVRQQAMTPVLARLADRVRAGQRAGRVDAAIVPQAAAAALGAVLDRLAAYHRELEMIGVKREDVVETCARIVLQTVRGSA
jgi:AcrR family transcriptional regulator